METLTDELRRTCLEALRPEEWLDVLTVHEDGVLPPCCSLISDLRDDLIGLLRMPTVGNAVQIVRVIEDHGASDPIDRLATELASVLDRQCPGWRERPGRSPEEVALIEARLTLFDQVPSVTELNWAARPRERWQPDLEEVAQLIVREVMSRSNLREQAALAHFERSRDALADLLRRGADPALLMALLLVARELLRLELQRP